MKCVLFAACLIALAGCVMPGDINALKLAQVDYQAKTESKIAEFKAGSITEEELRQALRQLEGEHNLIVERKGDEIAKRTDEAIKAVSGGLSLAEGGGLAGGATTLGMLALHLFRNATREKRIAEATKS